MGGGNGGIPGGRLTPSNPSDSTIVAGSIRAVWRSAVVCWEFSPRDQFCTTSIVCWPLVDPDRDNSASQPWDHDFAFRTNSVSVARCDGHRSDGSAGHPSGDVGDWRLCHALAVRRLGALRAAGAVWSVGSTRVSDSVSRGADRVCRGRSARPPRSSVGCRLFPGEFCWWCRCRVRAFQVAGLIPARRVDLTSRAVVCAEGWLGWARLA